MSCINNITRFFGFLFLRNMRLDLIGLLREIVVLRMRTRVHKSSCVTAETRERMRAFTVALPPTPSGAILEWV